MACVAEVAWHTQRLTRCLVNASHALRADACLAHKLDLGFDRHGARWCRRSGCGFQLAISFAYMASSTRFDPQCFVWVIVNAEVYILTLLIARIVRCLLIASMLGLVATEWRPGRKMKKTVSSLTSCMLSSQWWRCAGLLWPLLPSLFLLRFPACCAKRASCLDTGAVPSVLQHAAGLPRYNVSVFLSRNLLRRG